MLVSESLNSYRRGRFTIWLIIFNEALTEKDFDFQPAYKEEPLIQGVRMCKAYVLFGTIVYWL